MLYGGENYFRAKLLNSSSQTFSRNTGVICSRKAPTENDLGTAMRHQTVFETSLLIRKTNT
jgi:hypothetical protein